MAGIASIQKLRSVVRTWLTHLVESQERYDRVVTALATIALVPAVVGLGVLLVVMLT